ncbi:helix-turn-helix domain-containing protein [Lacunimicrobium album]
MATMIPENFETVAPSEADALLALESSRLLATQQLGNQSSIRLRLEGDNMEPISVPASAVRLFLHLLTEMSQGNSVTLIPTHAELTTQQAADLLNVSRPYVVKLLDEGKMPFRTVGKFRRIRFDDLMAYKRQDDEMRAKFADELTALSQELGGMGY